jgi:hypothetical protein
MAETPRRRSCRWVIDAKGVLAGSKDADRCVWYITKYLTNVYVLMRSGQLRSIKAGRARLIPLAAIDEFLSRTEEYAA